jgi:glutathione S-transferase
MTNSLTIYGHPASQPSRTVFWVCVMNGLPFTLGSTGGRITGTDELNPRGQVPSIVDDGFNLAEACAIASYLADKHGWESLYPQDLQTRARIQQFLHMHHSLVRLATLKLMAPHVVKPLGTALRGGDRNPLSILFNETLTAAFAADDPLTDGGRVVDTIAGFLEQSYFNDESLFICNTETASVADLVCYSELGQLCFANLFNFGRFPRIEKWLDAMSAVPGHDVIHAYNTALGDIASTPNTMERFTAASEAGFAALRETGLVA